MFLRKLHTTRYACLLVCLLLCGGRFAGVFATPFFVTTACAASAASQTSDSLENLLLTSLLNEEPLIDLTRLAAPVTQSALRTTFSKLYASVPALYFVSDRYTYSADGDLVRYMRPQYRYIGLARKSTDADFAARTSLLLRDIKPEWTDVQILCYLHDRMLETFDYDTAYEIYDPYTMLCEGRGVCQAYTLLFVALCDMAGILSEAVLCFEREHEWNQVCLNGQWYHIDLTWNETATPSSTNTRRPYFLLDDDTLRARRIARDNRWKYAVWDAPHPCTSKTFLSPILADYVGSCAI